MVCIDLDFPIPIKMRPFGDSHIFLKPVILVGLMDVEIGTLAGRGKKMMTQFIIH
jgi:hypothetical protein